MKINWENQSRKLKDIVKLNIKIKRGNQSRAFLKDIVKLSTNSGMDYLINLLGMGF